MSISASIPKLISAKVQKVLRNDLVAKKICTMETGSPIKGQGDTVYFVGLSKPTVGAYSGTINYENLSDASVALLIDQQNYFGFKIGDVEKFQSSIDLKGTQTEEAAYGLLNTADSYVFGLYAGANLTHTEAALKSTNVLSTVATSIRKLQEKNVKDRWMAIPPWMAEKIILAGISFNINEGMDGEKGGMAFLRYLDTDIYVTNNLVTTGSEGSLSTKVLAGSYNSIVFAEQIMQTKVKELENSFAIGVAGLHVFGAKVLKPDELLCATVTQAAETAI